MKFKIGLFVLLSLTLLFSSCVFLGNQEQIDYSDGSQEADESILETFDVQEIVATNIPTLSQTEIALTPVPSATVVVTQFLILKLRFQSLRFGFLLLLKIVFWFHLF